MNDKEYRQKREAELAVMSKQQLIDLVVDEELGHRKRLHEAEKKLGDALNHAKQMRLEFASKLDELKLTDVAIAIEENRRLTEEASGLRARVDVLSAEAVDLETAVASAIIGDVERLRERFRAIGNAEVAAACKGEDGSVTLSLRVLDKLGNIKSRMSGEDAALSAVASRAEAFLTVRKEAGSESPRYVPRPGLERIQEKAAELEGQCASLRSALEWANVERRRDMQAGLDLLLEDLDGRILAQDRFAPHAEIIRQAMKQVHERLRLMSDSYFCALHKHERR